MTLLNDSFSAASSGRHLVVPAGSSVYYKVYGTFSGVLLLQQAITGSAWETLATITAQTSGSIIASAKNTTHARYRFICESMASGTALAQLSDYVDSVTPLSTVSGSVIDLPYTQKNLRDTGTSSGTNTTTTLNDTAKAWVVNQFATDAKCVVVITTGLGMGQVRSIVSNTATALTVTTAWSTTPDATSTYEIIGTNYKLITETRDGEDLFNGHQASGMTFSGQVAALTTSKAIDEKFCHANTLRLESANTPNATAFGNRAYEVNSAGAYLGPVIANNNNMHLIFHAEASLGDFENYLRIRASTNRYTGILNWYVYLQNVSRYYCLTVASGFPGDTSGTIETLPKALSDVRASLENKNATNPNPLPPKANLISLKIGVRTPPKVVLVFDDGYVSTLDIIAPYLARYGIRATTAVATAYANELDIGANRFTGVTTGTTTTFNCQSAHSALVGQRVVFSGFADANWLRLNDTIHTITAKPTSSQITIDVNSTGFGALTTLTGRASMYCPPRMLNQLYNIWGWDCATHGANQFSGMTAAQISDELITTRSYLAQYGWTRAMDHHIYTGGAEKDASGNYVNGILKSLGFKTARMTRGSSDAMSPYPYGLAGRYFMPGISFDSYSPSAQLAALINKVERIMITGGIMTFTMHDVFATGTPTAANNMDLALFKSIADFLGPLHLDGKIECVTQSEMQKHVDDCTVLTPPADWE